MVSLPYVVALDAVGAGDVDLVGGKAANLGELVRAGFRVPPGFVVTTRVYAEALRAAGTDPATGADPAVLAGAIRALALGAELAAPVLDAYRGLGGGAVAVRSSATAEDLAGAAFAGQQETFLNVVGADEVLDALRACWASLWAGRAVAYRSRLGVEGVPQIAVVVQRMVPAASAGVLFTADPVTGARDRVVIEAGEGLGEAVVSGLVTPEHVEVDLRGRLLHRRSGRGEVVIRARAGGGVEREDGSVGGTRVEDPGPVLADEALRDLAATGRRIAEHFGRPQDVEWAHADGVTWIVQARPLTALPPAPIRTTALQRASGQILVELLPTRPYPLDLTAWTGPGWFAILRRMAAETVAVRIDVGAMLPARDGVLTELRPAEPHPTWRTLTTPLRMRSRVRRFDPARWTQDPRFAAFERALAELRARRWDTVTWAELVAAPGEVLALLHAFVDLRIDHLPRTALDVARLRLRLVLLGAAGQFWPLVGGAPTRTRAANDALAALAGQVRNSPAWREAFGSAADDELVATVWGDPGYAALREGLEAWLDAYGHRETTSAALVSAPTWREELALLLGNLRALVAHPDAAQQDDPWALALDRVRRAPLVRLTRSGDRVARLAAAARAAMAFREDSHFHALRPRPVLRAVLLEAGERLVRAGVLAHVDEVFHLELDELRGAPDPDGRGEGGPDEGGLDDDVRRDLQARVRRRAARRAELGSAPLISPATLHPRRRAASADALVTGTPGGGGRAAGVVRVVREPAEFGRLQRGDVLVCPYTNPAWTPLFSLAAAVVADAGSFGSHAAIVAREYGIPAVMGTGDGTRVLTDGTAVVVDGDRGEVVADRGSPGRG